MNTPEQEAMLDRVAIARGIDPRRARRVRECIAREEAERERLAAEDAVVEAEQCARREREAREDVAALCGVAGGFP